VGDAACRSGVGEWRADTGGVRYEEFNLLLSNTMASQRMRMLDCNFGV
jgi:hypothetical protein